MSDGKEEYNVFASNVEGKEVFVQDAEQGRHKYFCLGDGCKREVIRVLHNSSPHFRHYVKPGTIQKKCTYKDETYRHKLAKEILQREKRIKIPTLYKFPPKGVKGIPRILAETKTIEADHVKIERYIYETNDGKIKIGRKTEEEGLNLLVNPDVIFFNKKNEPILLIEIVATHKLNDEKKIKLSRLGIDTIQVTVPKDSPESIEKSLLNNANRAKWIYSNEEQNTEYIPVSYSSAEGISSIDEQQRKFFEESYKCRKARIRNLIRTIEKCLGSKQYRGINDAFESELSRVENNSERNRERLQSLQDKHRKGIERKYKEQVEELELGEELLEKKKNEFEQRYSDLESRYIAKKGELEDEERIIDFEIRGENKATEGGGSSIDSRKREIEGEIKAIGKNIELEEAEIKREVEDFGESIEFEKSETKRIQQETENLPEKYRQIEQDLRDRYRRLEEQEKSKIKDIESEEGGLPNQFEQDRKELEDRFNVIRKQSLRQLEERDVGVNTEFSRKLKKTIENGTLLHNLKKANLELGRVRKAKELIETNAYKNWND